MGREQRCSRQTGRQRLDARLHRRAGGGQGLARLGDDQRYRLADIADRPFGQHRRILVNDAVPVWPRHVGGGQHAAHAR